MQIYKFLSQILEFHWLLQKLRYPLIQIADLLITVERVFSKEYLQFFFFMKNVKISILPIVFQYLPLISGGSKTICRSNRPGRSKAGSRTSARFVPAKTTTFVVAVKPRKTVRKKKLEHNRTDKKWFARNTWKIAYWLIKAETHRTRNRSATRFL